MSGDAYSILRDAIIAKLQVVCIYQGHPREICPHVIGRKKGRRQVLSFQFAGSSASGLLPEGQWRCMIVDEIYDADHRDGDWHTGPSHLRPQTCVDEIDVEVTF